jgi:hypothetical protein
MRRATPIASVPLQQTGRNHNEGSLPTHGNPLTSQSPRDRILSTTLSPHSQAQDDICQSLYLASMTN